MDINDISTSGFSVYDDARQGTLVPGMVIPELTIRFAGGLKIICHTQVIYSEDPGEGRFRCGMAILDMNINAYSRLTDILINAKDPHSHVSCEVDVEELWEFLFDTGFIYPRKYGYIHSQKEEFKSTFKKLYLKSPEIAKHIIYHRYGKILAHISMVRVYEKAWMIHHHAARSTKMEKAGIRVLRQLMACLYDMYRLPSANMDYAIAFFRPESKFPEHVFGNFARSLENTGGCSMDLFSYITFPSTSLEQPLPEGWTLDEFSDFDLWELEQFYRHYSGGLLIDAMGVAQKPDGHHSLETLYERFELTRRLKIYSLKQEGELNAVLMVNQSNLGFNLSEIWNSIQVLVLNVEGLPWDILSIALGHLTKRYKSMRNVPILIYPQLYVNKKGIRYDRQYQMWILSVQYGDEYLKYMWQKFKIIYE